MPRIADIIRKWKKAGGNNIELTRSLIDLSFVSVLLDAGTGDHWCYIEPGTQRKYERSGGVAITSLHMFNALAFASDKCGNTPVVDGEHTGHSLQVCLFDRLIGKGLEQLATDTFANGFQVSYTNPMIGLDSRVDLLRNLGRSLLASPDILGHGGRPGALAGKFDHHITSLSWFVC